MPQISIVVPIYNTEIYLSSCIDSVLSQTFRDFELLLINDGSTDKSEEICIKYVNVDNRVKLFNKINGGKSSALNLGIEEAIGKYLIVLDADDYWCDSEILQKLYLIAEQYQLDIIRGECNEVNNDGQVLKQYIDTKPKGFHSKVLGSGCFIDRIVQHQYFVVLCLIRKDSIGNIRFNTQRVFLEDAEFYITYLNQQLRCMYVPEIFYAYRKHSDSITVRHHPQKLSDAFNFSRFCYRAARKAQSDEMRVFCIKEGCRNYLFDLSVLAESERNYKELLIANDVYALTDLRRETIKSLKGIPMLKRALICYCPVTFAIYYFRSVYVLKLYIRKILNLLTNE